MSGPGEEPPPPPNGEAPDEPPGHRGPSWGGWGDGPWRADGGGWGPWDPRHPRAREMRRRARLYRRGEGRRPWRRRQGFGWIFGVLFLVIAGSILTATASVLSHLGPVPVVITAVAIVAIVAALFRGVAGAARDLDSMVAATRRVEEGDYAVRLGETRSDLPPIQELAGGFDTMVARLEADEEQRRTLLADVSHELRTPLTVITGNLEAILDGVYPADPDHLTPILDETRVMARLIEDLRTVALSEAGTLALHPEPTDPDVLIGEVLRAFTPGAAATGVTIKVESVGDLPIIEIDPVRIREVLSNLVANALRYTPSGGTVALGGSATASRVTLTVRDTGPGIEPSLLPHVFDRFVKGSGSRGSGLGLAIARGLVEAHGGTISVASPPGVGTTFRVELPQAPER
ncbi:MAG: two-component system, OmpR family, sensor histidine kinase BaeS [Chloroflexota bacterium]|nr:two-component system, OmpR family, sensor histidine kinase BaeS [Chloroflexota bacterium]